MTEILLVDDERAIRDFLSRLLREAGFTVLIAANGAAGVETFHERRPDLVLLDVMMPGIDLTRYPTEMTTSRLYRPTSLV